MKRLRLFLLVVSTIALVICLIWFFVARGRVPQGSRVEVVFALPPSQAEAAAAEVLTSSGDQLASVSQSWDDGRWTSTGVDPFTAQYLGAALRQIGLSEEQFLVLDYSWADEVALHSAQLWQITGAFCLLYLLGALIIAQARREHQSVEKAMHTQYLSQYLSQRGERLITKLILLVPMLLIAAVVIRWLWRVELCLPTGFLPEGSIFDADHYLNWIRITFPEGQLSEYGFKLGKTLPSLYGTAFAISILEILVTIGLLSQKRRDKYK